MSKSCLMWAILAVFAATMLATVASAEAMPAAAATSEQCAGGTIVDPGDVVATEYALLDEEPDTLCRWVYINGKWILICQ